MSIDWIEEKDQTFEINHITNKKYEEKKRNIYQTFDTKCVVTYYLINF